MNDYNKIILGICVPLILAGIAYVMLKELKVPPYNDNHAN